MYSYEEFKFGTLKLCIKQAFHCYYHIYNNTQVPPKESCPVMKHYSTSSS